jgi:hypothetical protein
MKLWNVIRTPGDAVATANAILLLKIDDTIRVFDNCTFSRAGPKAARIFAVHALILAQQPHEIAVKVVLDEFDQVVVVPFRRGHRLVGIVEGRLAERMIVPFNAGDFARFAADACANVDILADLFFTTRASTWNRSGMR